MLDGDAVGNRALRGLAGLHADKARTRTAGSERDRDSGRKTAAADREDERLDRRQLVGELETERPLAGDHGRVLERVHERRAGLVGARQCQRERLVEPGPGEHSLGAVVARRLDLGHRCVLRHEHGRLDPELPRRPRDRLAVVAGARREHARRALARRRASSSLLTAPRTLNEPVRCRFSAFRHTVRPTRRESESLA